MHNRSLFPPIARPLWLVLLALSVLRPCPLKAVNNTLVIPLGSYLNAYNPADSIYSIKEGTFSGFRLSTRENLTDCWLNGGDIYQTPLAERRSFSLACKPNTENPSATGVNAANFLYKPNLPAGPYLRTCYISLAMITNGRKHLYTQCCIHDDCLYRPGGRNFKYGHLDITDCPEGQLRNNQGVVTCSQSPEFRQIVDGPYLGSCELAYTYYHAHNDRLSTQCDGKVRSFTGVTSCINNNQTISYNGANLVCTEATNGPAKIHTESRFLPAGSYTLSCKNMSFFPCLGPSREGTLVAECISGRAGVFAGVRYGDGTKVAPIYGFTPITLLDADNACRMKEMGFISNFDSTLGCDPGSVPEQGYQHEYFMCGEE